RMLKKSLFSPTQPPRAKTRFSQSIVLSSSKSSTCRWRFSEVGRTGGVFCSPRSHCAGERPHEMRSVPSPVLIRLRPCQGIGNGGSYGQKLSGFLVFESPKHGQITVIRNSYATR